MTNAHDHGRLGVDRRALAGALVLVAALMAAEIVSLNVRGAFVHVTRDLAAFAGTAVAGGVVLATGWDRADPIASLLVAALMLWASAGLLRRELEAILVDRFGVDHTTLKVDHVGSHSGVLVEIGERCRRESPLG